MLCMSNQDSTVFITLNTSDLCADSTEVRLLNGEVTQLRTLTYYIGIQNAVLIKQVYSIARLRT